MTTLKARVNGEWVPISTGSGGGTGADEVWVGPDTPPSAEAELWYDTDDEPAAVDAANFWNSAWGIVATATPRLETSPVTFSNGGAYLTNTVAFTTIVGRRYRLVAALRGVGVGAAFYMNWTDGWNTGKPVPGLANANFVNAVPSGTWGGAVHEWITDGTGIAYNYACLAMGTGTPTSTVYLDGSAFYIEDIGPVTKAAVNPPAGQPTIATAGNALGVIARTPFLVNGVNSLPVAVITPFTPAMTVTLLVGRRYRIGVFCRAFTSSTETVGQAVSVSLTDNGAISQIIDGWTATPMSYGSFHISGLVDGDGLAHSFVFRAEAKTQAATFYGGGGSYGYVEDVGPNTSPALPIPETPPAWTPLVINPTAANGWTQRAGETPLSYRVVGDEVVVRGSVNVWTGINAGNVLTTLPPGARPLYPVQAASTMEVPTGPSWFPIRIGVRTNGEITVNGMTSAQGFIGINLRFSVSP